MMTSSSVILSEINLCTYLEEYGQQLEMGKSFTSQVSLFTERGVFIPNDCRSKGTINMQLSLGHCLLPSERSVKEAKARHKYSGAFTFRLNALS